MIEDSITHGVSSMLSYADSIFGHAKRAIARTQVFTMQDAIAQHTLAFAEKEEEQAARQSVLQSASSGVSRGSLPNLFLGSYGDARLLAHPRYILACARLRNITGGQ